MTIGPISAVGPERSSADLRNKLDKGVLIESSHWSSDHEVRLQPTSPITEPRRQGSTPISQICDLCNHGFPKIITLMHCSWSFMVILWWILMGTLLNYELWVEKLWHSGTFNTFFVKEYHPRLRSRGRQSFVMFLMPWYESWDVK
jgi:hypothetical protein